MIKRFLVFVAIGAIIIPATRSTPAIDGRVIGGAVVAPNNGLFPYLVGVYFDTDQGTFFCGGTLIDPKWVLTAGHCVYGAKIFTLVLGSNFLEDQDPYRVTVAATYSVLHPNFSDSSLENNVGLIRIDNEYVTNTHIQPVVLDTKTIQSDEYVVAIGWGATGDWNGVSGWAYFVYLSTISNEACRSIYGPLINDNVVCALGSDPNEPQGVCTGDIGGPLIQFSSDFRTSLVGIISFGGSPDGCAATNPSGFVRLVPYRNWIREQTGI